MAKGVKTGGGSRAGVPNKVTRSLKDMLEGALKAKGGQKWIEEQMDHNPGAVLSLLGKTLPRQVDVKAEVETKGVIIMANQHDIDL